MIPKTHVQFERMVRHYGLKPIVKVVEDDGTEIMIADGFVPPQGDLWKDHFSEEFPAGLYQTMWCVCRGGLDVGRPLMFDALHDLHLTESMRLEGRVDAALKDARIWIDADRKTGRYAA